MLKAGFARVPITPEMPMTLAGFDRRTEPSEGGAEDLYVSALALQAGEEPPFLLCAFDLLGCDRALCDGIRQALDLSQESIWICATHTHAAPRGAFSGGVSQNNGYIALAINCCKAAALSAISDLQPAEAYWGEAHVPQIASLRDVPREKSDYEMPLLSLRLQRASDCLRLIRIQCHPTVLDERNLQITRDLAGFSKDEKTLVLNGACADLSTRFTRQNASFEELERLRTLLQDALYDLQWQKETAFGTRMKTVSQTLALPYGNAVRGEERLRLLNEVQKQAEACTDLAARRELEACIAVLERGDRLLPTTRTVTVSACNLGSRLLLAVPFEVSHSDSDRLSTDVKALCGKPAHLICYCGGYDGYLPHETQGINYQDLATGYLPQAREQIWQALLSCAANAVK